MSQPSPWLNRTVLGAGLTSFLADVGYEMASVILPAFLLMLGIPQSSVARVIGLIEGTADLLSNAVKIAVGWYSDRIGQRKAFVVGGYALTGSAFALCALAVSLAARPGGQVTGVDRQGPAWSAAERHPRRCR